VDYFNKMAELAFATVFNTRMYKKVNRAPEIFRKQTILRRSEKKL